MHVFILVFYVNFVLYFMLSFSIIRSRQCIVDLSLVRVLFWFPEPRSSAFGKPSLFIVCSCISFISSVFFGWFLCCNPFFILP